jgi:hypothetical protein
MSHNKTYDSHDNTGKYSSESPHNENHHGISEEIRQRSHDPTSIISTSDASEYHDKSPTHSVNA